MSESEALPEIPSGYPKYNPLPWDFDGHVHTLFSKFSWEDEGLEAGPPREMQFPIDDDTDDKLHGWLHTPKNDEDKASERPLIVLFHGLGGDAKSDYMQNAGRWLLKDGYRVLLANFRGCGAGGEICRHLHHPGRVADLNCLVEGVKAADDGKLAEKGLILVGLSLGGNQLLRYLAEYQPDSAVLGAAVVSAPLDLAATSKWLHEPQNRGYEWYVLDQIREQVLRNNAAIGDDERQCVKDAGSLWQLDECFTAPHCGFDSVEEYYRDNSATGSLDKIDMTTLVIYAADDPFVPAGAYRERDWESNAKLIPLLVESGGHVGFHDREEQPWHHRCISHFAGELATRDAS